MADTAVKEGYLYTNDHEWVGGEGGQHRVGITAFAVEQLGDITMVDLKVKVGDKVAKGAAFGVVESVKSVSDLFAPVSGEIVAINGELEGKPELVNEEPYGKGWMVALKADGAIEGLMDAAAYQAFLKTM